MSDSDSDRVYVLEAELIAMKTEKDQLLRQNEQLKRKLKELETHILMEKPQPLSSPSPQANEQSFTASKSARVYTQSPQMRYYHAHKSDARVIREVQKRMAAAGLQDYPISWHWIKRVTDEEYELLKEQASVAQAVTAETG